MSYITRQPCPLPKCGKLHGVRSSRPGTRSGFAGSGGAIESRPGYETRQPVGASAPERQVSPPPDLSTTG